MMLDTAPRAAIPRASRRSPRVLTDIPVRLRLIGPEGVLYASGTAVISDVSEDGVRLSRVSLHTGAIPPATHFAILIPAQEELAGLWIKLCVVRAVFRADCAELGGYVVAASGFRRLLEPAADGRP
jgi:hypothetical protein